MAEQRQDSDPNQAWLRQGPPGVEEVVVNPRELCELFATAAALRAQAESLREELNALRARSNRLESNMRAERGHFERLLDNIRSVACGGRDLHSLKYSSLALDAVHRMAEENELLRYRLSAATKKVEDANKRASEAESRAAAAESREAKANQDLASLSRNYEGVVERLSRARGHRVELEELREAFRRYERLLALIRKVADRPQELVPLSELDGTSAALASVRSLAANHSIALSCWKRVADELSAMKDPKAFVSATRLPTSVPIDYSKVSF